MKTLVPTETDKKTKIPDELLIPCDPMKVKHILRTIGAPVTLFGESGAERRNRLKKVLSESTEKNVIEQIERANSLEIPKTVMIHQTKNFYTAGSTLVADIRLWVAKYSLVKAKTRIAAQLRGRKTAWKTNYIKRASTLLWVRQITNDTSEFADIRPVSCCKFTADGKHIVTAGWTGNVKIWSVTEGNILTAFRAHDMRITGVAINPNDDLTCRGPAFATGSEDQEARIWTSEGKLINILSGHNARLGRLAFHPSGRLLATTSFDQCWRLWDLERTCSVVTSDRHVKSTPEMLYKQGGHSRPVYTVAFQHDGSLLATGGLDAYGKVWDVRTGRNILTLEGHVKPILALDFSPNGQNILTGSIDNSCRLWDLRKSESQVVITAHKNVVSQVKYGPELGDYFVTASYDSHVRIWSSDDGRLIRVLSGHVNKVLDVDIHPHHDLIATVGYDRTLKFWKP